MAPCRRFSRKVPLFWGVSVSSAPVVCFPFRCYFDLVCRCRRAVAKLRRGAGRLFWGDRLFRAMESGFFALGGD